MNLREAEIIESVAMQGENYLFYFVIRGEGEWILAKLHCC